MPSSFFRTILVNAAIVFPRMRVFSNERVVETPASFSPTQLPLELKYSENTNPLPLTVGYSDTVRVQTEQSIFTDASASSTNFLTLGDANSYDLQNLAKDAFSFVGQGLTRLDSSLTNIIDDFGSALHATTQFPGASGQSVVDDLYPNLLPVTAYGEFPVNTNTLGIQGSQSVIQLTSGNFFICWESSTGDGDGYGVNGQLYFNSGAVSGYNFRLNAYTIGDQRAPVAQALSTGGFMVAWLGNGPSGFGVNVRTFSSLGVASAIETRINNYPGSLPGNPYIGWSSSGFAICFSDAMDAQTRCQGYDNNGGLSGSLSISISPNVYSPKTIILKSGRAVTLTTVDQIVTSRSVLFSSCVGFGTYDTCDFTESRTSLSSVVYSNLTSPQAFRIDPQNNSASANQNAIIAPLENDSYGVFWVLQPVGRQCGTNKRLCSDNSVFQQGGGCYITTNYPVSVPGQCPWPTTFPVFSGTYGTYLVRYSNSSQLIDSQIISSFGIAISSCSEGFVMFNNNASIQRYSSKAEKIGNVLQISTDSNAEGLLGVKSASGNNVLSSWVSRVQDSSGDLLARVIAFSNPLNFYGTSFSSGISRNQSFVFNQMGFTGLDRFESFNDRPVTITLTLSSPTLGSFSVRNIGSTTTTNSAGTWSLSGLASEADTILNGLEFYPNNLGAAPINIATNITMNGNSTVGNIQLSYRPDFLNNPVNAHLTGQQAAVTGTINNDDTMTLAWISDKDGSGQSIAVQSFNKNGDRLTQEIQASSYREGDQVYPKLAYRSDGNLDIFYVSSVLNKAGTSIIAQRCNATLSKMGAAIPIVNSRVPTLLQLAIARLTSGAYNLIWSESGDIFYKKIDDNFLDVTLAQQLNVFTDRDQSSPCIVAFPSDIAMGLWQSEGQDGSGKGIVGQFISDSGVKINSELLINTVTEGDQSRPAAVVVGNEAWACWESWEGRWKIKFQRVGSSGAKIGSERLVSNQVGDQRWCAIQKTSDERVVVIGWQTKSNVGWDVYFQLYASDGTVIGNPVLANAAYASGDQQRPFILPLTDKTFRIFYDGAGPLDPDGIFMTPIILPLAMGAPSVINGYLGQASVSISGLRVLSSPQSNVVFNAQLSVPAAGVLSSGLINGASVNFNATTGLWSVSGSIDEVNAHLASFVFLPAPGFSDDFALNCNLTDGVSPPQTATIAMASGLNNAPVFTAPLINQVAGVGQEFSYNFPPATDINNDPVTYSGVYADGTALRWEQVDANSRRIYGTPGSAHEGVKTIKIITSDNRGGSSASTFQLTVNPTLFATNATYVGNYTEDILFSLPQISVASPSTVKSNFCCKFPFIQPTEFAC